MTLGLAPLLCLALNIYGEARGEELEGQLAVAQVTLNRVAHPAYPDDVCSVVFQRKQFSWTNKAVHIEEPKALAQALVVATAALLDRPTDQTEGATHFYSGKNPPSWVKGMVPTGRIGNHTFLRSK